MITEPSAPGSAAAGPVAAGPTPLDQRALAPDLARGAVLLLVCLANAHLYLYGRGFGIHGYPSVDTLSGTDRVVTLLQMTFVDGRAFPMFAVLLGYGSAQLARRRLQAGATRRATTALVRRRGAFLLLFGAAHGLLLFPGDIAGTYGLLMIAGAGLVVGTRSTALRALVVAQLVVIAGLGALTGLQGNVLAVEADPAQSGPWWMEVLWNAVGWMSNVLFGLTLEVFGAVAAGVLAARWRWLDEPGKHLMALRYTAGLGLGAAVLGGLPLALVTAGFTTLGAHGLALAGLAHAVTGYAGGVGFAALAGLVSAWCARTSSYPAPVRWCLALGRRSLTGYLLHSAVFVAVFSWWAGGVGAHAGVASAAAVAAGTWVVLLVVAAGLETGGRRGPAEVLLRRLTYARSLSGRSPGVSAR